LQINRKIGEKMKIEKELKYLKQVLQEYEFTFQEILQLMDWSPKKRKLYKQIVNAWEENGEIYLKRNGKYTLPEKAGLLKGEISIANGSFGFLDVQGEKSVFIPGPFLNTAMDGDTVIVRVLKENVQGDRKREGEVLQVVKRNREVVVGIFEHNMSFGFVRVKNSRKDIYISKKKIKGAKTGDLVAVKVYFWGDDTRKPEGEVVSILGDPQDTEALISSLLISEGIQEKFPGEVLKELDSLDEDLSAEIPNRRDLRDLDIITIDGADAKDLDDAVYVEKTEDGYKLIVSIADVSYYVKEGTELDNEALKRGNSIYLVDRVIPMLPRKLSNNLCSLNPDEDKMTFSVEIDFDEKGKVLKNDFYKSVIKSKFRMTYDGVNQIYDYIDNREKTDLSEKEIEKLEEQAKLNAPKVDFYDDLTGSDTTAEIGTVAKVLNFKSVGRNTLFDILRRQGILQRDNMPFQTYVDRGYFRVVESKWNAPNGDVKANYKTVVYQKGIEYISKVLRDLGYEKVGEVLN